MLVALGSAVLLGAAAFGAGYWLWPAPDPRVIAAETNQSVPVLYADRSEMTRIVPAGGDQQRDNARELQLKAQLEKDLPMEEDLSRWFPLWDVPL